jgi:hypothetical protein
MFPLIALKHADTGYYVLHKKIQKSLVRWYCQKEYELIEWVILEFSLPGHFRALFYCAAMHIGTASLSCCMHKYSSYPPGFFIPEPSPDSKADLRMIQALLKVNIRSEFDSYLKWTWEIEDFISSLYFTERYNVNDFLVSPGRIYSWSGKKVDVKLNFSNWINLILFLGKNPADNSRNYLPVYLLDRRLIRPGNRMTWNRQVPYINMLKGSDLVVQFILTDPMDDPPFLVRQHKSGLILYFLRFMADPFYLPSEEINKDILIQRSNMLGRWRSQLKCECSCSSSLHLRSGPLHEKVTPFEETDSTKIQVYKECINIIDEILSHSSK